MARMRYVKPEYWTDSKIVKLGPWARLLYIGSWNFAICESGHLDDDAMALKLKVLPADPIDADEVLEEIVASGRIVRKTLPDGRTYLHIPRLGSHQKTESRWGTRCPYCSAENPPETSIPPAAPSNLSEPLPKSVEVQETLPISAQEGIGGDRREKDGAPPAKDAASKIPEPRKGKPRRSPETPCPSDFTPTDAHRTFAASQGVDVDVEARRFIAHAHSKDRRLRDWDQAFRLWIDKSRDFGSRSDTQPEVKGDGTADPDAILGRDTWQPPTPPPHVTPGTRAAIDWTREQWAAHNRERQAEAEAVLARRRSA